MKKKMKETTKDAILKCAIQEFIEFGYYGARMQRIADRAKVNKAMLFYYFSSKEQIYREVLGSVFTAVFSRLQGLGDEPVPVERKIRQIVDIYFDAFTARPDYVKLVLYEMITGAKHLKSIAGGDASGLFDPRGPLSSYFRARARGGEIRNVDVLQLLVSVIGQIVMPFIGRPFIEMAASRAGASFDFDGMMAARREFIVTLVCDGIRKRGARG